MKSRPKSLRTILLSKQSSWIGKGKKVSPKHNQKVGARIPHVAGSTAPHQRKSKRVPLFDTASPCQRGEHFVSIALSSAESKVQSRNVVIPNNVVILNEVKDLLFNDYTQNAACNYLTSFMGSKHEEKAGLHGPPSVFVKVNAAECWQAPEESYACSCS